MNTITSIALWNSPHAVSAALLWRKSDARRSSSVMLVSNEMGSERWNSDHSNAQTLLSADAWRSPSRPHTRCRSAAINSFALPVHRGPDRAERAGPAGPRPDRSPEATVVSLDANTLDEVIATRFGARGRGRPRGEGERVDGGAAATRGRREGDRPAPADGRRLRHWSGWIRCSPPVIGCPAS